MVTHDIGLKYFSDRIIWLRDGKIQRVEVVNKEKKEESYQQLYQDLQVWLYSWSGVTSLGWKEATMGQQELGVGREREGESSSSSSSSFHNFLNTAIRKPQDYQTHVDYDAENAVRLDTFTEYKKGSGKNQKVERGPEHGEEAV